MFVSDYVLNGQGRGEVGQALQGVHFDPGYLRPYIDQKGRRCVTINTGRMVYNNAVGEYFPERRKVLIQDLMARGIFSPVFNATSLRKEEWIELDRKVIRAARFRLKAWADLAAANSYGGFNGMAKMTLEYEAMSDPGEAVVDMDGLSQGRTDNPLFKLRSLPLPITHSDFWYSARRLAVSSNSGTPLDSTSGEAAGRRVGEMIEKTLIGVETGVTYGTQSTGVTAHDGTSTVYGYINHPNRITYTTLTTPTGSNPEATITNILAMRELMYSNKFYGPFMLYNSTDWDKFLDNDYARLGGSNANMTLRDRIRKIDDIQDIRRLDFLPAAANSVVASANPFTLIMVQMTSDVAQAVNGMDITTVQWEGVGGLRRNFKVMAIQVPRILFDYNGIAAIIHATTS